jgi:hypothetical protein
MDKAAEELKKAKEKTEAARQKRAAPSQKVFGAGGPDRDEKKLREAADHAEDAEEADSKDFHKAQADERKAEENFVAAVKKYAEAVGERAKAGAAKVAEAVRRTFGL